MIRKVLLVDDEPNIRKIATLGLGHVGGWEVVSASNGKECIELATSEQPDVILLDANMPEMDGVTTLEALRASPTTASIPVVFLTARLLDSERARVTSLGVAGIIAKPFDAMRLADEIRRIIEGPS
jgi:CheY-like chemotaxis protein